MKKYPIITLVSIVVILFLSGCINNTDGKYETFTSGNGFSFEYPADWELDFLSNRAYCRIQ